MTALSQSRLHLDSDLVGVDLPALHQRMLDALSEQCSVIVDASSVERASAASLQLLTAFAAEAANKAHPLVWEKPSRAFLDAARLLGLREALGLPKEP